MCEGERDLSLCDILKFLNTVKIRATYRAVARVLGIPERGQWRRILGPPRHKTSWIVSQNNGRPSGYQEDQYHPCLFRTDEIIRCPEDLRAKCCEFFCSEGSTSDSSNLTG